MDSKENGAMDSKKIPPPCGVLTREQVLKILGDCIKGLQTKGISGRFKDIDLEKARDAKMRLMIYACSIYLSGLKDQTLDDLEQRINQLEGGIS